MFKKIIIVVLILIILGLYFYTEETKAVLQKAVQKITGKAVEATEQKLKENSASLPEKTTQQQEDT